MIGRHVTAVGRSLGGTLLAALCLLGVTRDAAAQSGSFPGRAVTIVSPYQAGGTSDIIARVLARKLSDIWNQPVIVENRPGANGAVGASAVARAPADGLTLLATASSGLTLNPLLFRNLPYDVNRDFAPITRTGLVANVVVVNAVSPFRTLEDLRAAARAKPGTLSFASQGNGSNGHLNGEMFKQLAGVDLLHVPYRGSAPAVSDLIGGQVGVMFDNLPSVLEQIRGGRLRALAVTTAARSPFLPETPTMAEAGLAGFDTSAWFAVLVARTTPEPIRAEIERAVLGALADPAVAAQLHQSGVVVIGKGAADLAGAIEAETGSWRQVIDKAGIRIE